ncbi:hypothetical protein TCAL_12296 [Tigriopus californicus]|uniref:Uncharacterized protein n=1 Tax=Tigriopus californicus TaxID=6832 RepID=A0A553NFH0_TIGCA|nr:uncharacterized protein LOC131888299 [Tigriopus californicus]TRY64148.1 hypothetical protein TCAL_12296 [Tigriopus californicus]|eukprot:TCALIF_12296-PA protein Name:"Protein of unknown function" AED:0.00 eAED:0.00 QI:233/1/1/1/1/1/2/41/103
MRFISTCAAVLIAMSIVSIVRESDCLTQEERSFLSSELRSWLVEANQGLIQPEYATLPADQSAFVSLLDRRLRNDGKAQGKSGDKWNNIGMHNLFRLDKRSRL